MSTHVGNWVQRRHKSAFGVRAGKVLCAAALVASMSPAAAFAAEGEAPAALTVSAQEAAAKTNYGLTVTASFSGTQEVTFAGFAGGRAGRMTVAAMENPSVTIVDAAGAQLATASALGSDGKVAISSTVALGIYKATVSSDNFNDVTVTFAYPAASSMSLGGAQYWYFTKTDDALALVDAAAKTDEALVAAGWSAIEGSDVWYQAAPGSTVLSGVLYGMDTTQAVNYSSLYNGLIGDGAASAADYDAISSATGIVANKHYSQLSKLVAQDIVTDAATIGAGATEEQKLANKITGAFCTPKAIEGDANVKAFVEASILGAAGAAMTPEQEALASGIRLNGNAAVNPATVTDRVAVDTVTTTGFVTGCTYFDQVSLSADKAYGDIKLVIRPMAGANTAGGAEFSWADYYQSLYAGTISDGTTTVGLAPWIDLYAEAGHSAVEMSISNGKNIYNNTSKATVNRFAAMYDEATGRLKAGDYTVTLYAAGYNPLSYTFKVGAAVPSANLRSIAIANADVADGAQATIESFVPEVNADGKTVAKADSVIAENAVVGDGAIALDRALAAGSYRVDVDGYVYTFDVSRKAVGVAAAIEGAELAVAKAACAAVGIEYDAAKSIAENMSDASDAMAAAKAEAAAAKAEASAAKDEAKAAQAVVASALKANPMTVKANSVAAKAKKNTSIAAKKAFTVKNAQGKVSYYKISGNAKISVSAKGKVTVKKGLKKGKTVKAKVLVTAAGNKSYAPMTKIVTLKVKVK